MTRFASVSALSLLVLAALTMSACGSSRKLQSVTITPAAAEGQAQFTATGTFSSPPSPAKLTSRDVMWCVGPPANAASPIAGVCEGNVAPFATVDQNGLAQCSPSSQGTVYILAGTGPPPAMPDQGQQLTVYGQALLTCP
jgi:hypothetical protein